MSVGRRDVKWLLLVGTTLAFGSACGGPVDEARHPVRSIGEVSGDAKAALASRRIFFGHQSVGANIMQGVTELARADRTLRLRVVEPGEAWPVAGGYFAHGQVGKNGEPSSKTDDFVGQMAGGIGARVDIAFHKYCYVDIRQGTDPSKVFGHYRSAMARLRELYPAVTFVHVTVPVTVVQAGPKAVVKRVLGRAPGGYADNIRREQFNELMRREYTGREPIFDLAAVESTAPDRTRQQFEFQGQRGLALFPPYASDGRHLGEIGRRRVAEELLVLLASLGSGGAQ